MLCSVLVTVAHAECMSYPAKEAKHAHSKVDSKSRKKKKKKKKNTKLQWMISEAGTSRLQKKNTARAGRIRRRRRPSAGPLLARRRQ